MRLTSSAVWSNRMSCPAEMKRAGGKAFNALSLLSPTETSGSFS